MKKNKDNVWKYCFQKKNVKSSPPTLGDNRKSPPRYATSPSLGRENGGQSIEKNRRKGGGGEREKI